ncbi:RNA polymerase sigma-70 factor [Siphonobacter sp. SORGH_AS_0500]|uniref:RNA polymerase sigma-70 factor n=1 Tax=Siphonobacter sp. SORGH_AS_0500 TaxID=1864824 RepID=UPI0012FF4276|nr:RNA polymerase sigma-70 factor [Siphonobacter sp. SORGH_AS_0500]
MANSIHPSVCFSDICQFEQIYNRYWKKMYDLARYYTQNSDQAEEIVQDIFKSLWERKDTLIINGPLEHYLFRCVKLKIAEHYRQEALRQKHQNQLLQTLPAEDMTTENQVLSNELSRRLEELTVQLPHQSRRVFELSRNQGLSNRQIAAELSLSEKTIENYLTRALHFLRKQLADYLHK